YHNPRHEGSVHELSLDSALSALDFQTRDLPIPTLAGILGTDDATALDAPRLSELRTLLRDAPEPLSSAPAPDRGPVLSPDVEPSPAGQFAFDTTPRSDFFADLEVRADELNIEPELDSLESLESEDALGTPRFTPPSRLFGDDSDARPPARSARTFIGLVAAAGAL